MGAAQIIMIVLFSFGFSTTVAKQGKPKGNYSIGEYLIGVGIYVALLWWGGFWG